MSRDVKPKKTRAPQKKSRGGTLIGVFIGIVVGVGIAAAVVYSMNKAPVPFVNKVPAAKETTADGKPLPPVALPGKPGDPAPEKRFQFYDILPGKADAVPDKMADAKGKEETKKDEKAQKKDDKKEDKKEEKDARKEEPKEAKQTLFLQAGSFTRAQDADNQKANLALMGVEAVVQQVMVQDKTFYRVRIGPYSRLDELNKMRGELAKAGIDAQLAKPKE